jgi:hypothetical protein
MLAGPDSIMEILAVSFRERVQSSDCEVRRTICSDELLEQKMGASIHHS